jgi:hypothetical protein
MRNSITLFVISCFVSIFIWSHAFANAIPIESLLPKKLPEGWRQIGSPQVYNPKNLFKRINGQAELFFKYGFQKSVSAMYQNNSNPKDQIEVDLYDMGNALQAFGVFSRFRGEDRPAGVGLESYVEDTSLLFYKGRYFVMLYATETDPSFLKRMAVTISSGIADSTPAPKEIGYFPKNGLRPGSIEYYPEGLLGYQFFKRGFQGVYEEKVEAKAKAEAEAKAKAEAEAKAKAKAEAEAKAKAEDELRAGDREFHLFLAIFSNSQDSKDALKTYRDVLSKRGKVDSITSAGFGPNSLKGEDPNRGKMIIVAKGFYLAGITGFDSVGYAEKLLEEFLKNIQ